MNNFQNFHSMYQYQHGRRVQCQSFNQQNSQTPQRTRSESRLQYLRKLLSENLRIDEKSSDFLQRKRMKENQSEMKIFDKSNLILHSNKFIQKYYARDNHQSLYLGSEITKKRENKIKRYIKISEYDNTLQLKEKQNFQSKKYKLKENFQLSKVNKIDLYKQKKKRNISEKQLNELKHIGRLLEEIKFEIFKNRSLIIEGINETKKTRKQKTYLPYLSLDNSIVSSDQNSVKNERRLYGKSVDLKMNFKGPKPTVLYKKFNKIR